MRQALSPASTMLFSFSTQDDRRFALDTTDPTTTIGVNEPHSKGWTAEAQHLYRSDLFNTVIGVGVSRISRHQFTSINQDPILTVDDLDGSVTHATIYGYSYWNILRNTTVTLGVSGDLFDAPGNQITNGTFFGVPLPTTQVGLS